MLARYISNELTDQRGRSRTTEMQPIMLYQNRQVVFTPNFCHRRASISVKLNRSVERPESFAKTAVLEDSCKVFRRPRFAVILRASHLAPHAFALTRRWEPGDAEPQMTRKMFATPRC